VLFDAIGLFLAVLFVALGVFRGTLAGFLRVATVVSAYVSGYLAASHFSHVVTLLTGMSQIAAAAILGTVAFSVVYLVLAIISSLLIRAERERRSDSPRGTYDRIGGAFFGVVQALVSLLLLAVLGSVLDAAYRAGLPQGVDASHSFLVGSTRQVVATGVGAAMGDSAGSKLAVKLISDPGHALTSAQQLLSGPRFGALQADELFWNYVSEGQVDRALTRSSFSELMHDEPTRAALADLGMVPEEARKDPQVFRETMRETLTAAAPRIKAIRNDPEFAQIVADPEVQRAIDSGDNTALLTNPEVRSLINRILRDFEETPAPSPAP